uniref:RING-type domain-containing protein n=1 Tax=Branchiostoma floridae TaxID=7739 RepID=C3ZCP7_BRAFL|eukprot:XP_002593740.1 hypothetical protein BRAFLDRAFT_86108 [Branchiostoma floridae]
MEDPWECPCGHVFCKVCIQHWLQSHMFSNCPVCRVPCFKFQLRPVVHMVRNLINCLTVRCENSEAGCDKNVELQKYDSHKKVREICLKVCAGKNLKWRVCAIMALEELAEEFALNVQDDFKTVCQKAGVRPQRIQVIMDKVLDDFESDLL